jgi:hypothetical protein
MKIELPGCGQHFVQGFGAGADRLESVIVGRQTCSSAEECSGSEPTELNRWKRVVTENGAGYDATQ